MLRGGTNIVPYISRERFLVKLFYLQTGRTARPAFGPGAFVNHIADPDICRGALQLAANLVRKVSRPCFNHPSAVLRSARDEVARTLTGIPGLAVPKTIRVPASLAAVREAITQSGLDYPILARVAGTHAGKTLIKIGEPQGLEEIGRLNAGTRSLYITEFRDFAYRNGGYRKFRVALVGDEILLRHCIIADHWLLHAPSRASNTGEEERAMFDAFDGPWSSHLHPLFREIGRRLGLDYFGVDCTIDAQGTVLLFEANACMSILLNTSPSPNIWDEPIARINAAVEKRLAEPSTWYGPVPAEPVQGQADLTHCEH